MITLEKALILLKIDCLGSDCLENVLEVVKERKEIKQSGMTFGEYDIYAIAEVERSLEVSRLVMDMRSIPSVSSTTTLLIVDE